MTYQVLALDANTQRMTVPALRHIAAMVDKGMKLCGARPQAVLSLNDDKAEFDRLVAEIWDANRPNVKENASIADALAAWGIAPDFYCDHMDSLRFVHRQTPQAEIYWVNNRSYQTRSLDARFRVTGMKPYLWHPETGEVSAVDYTPAAGYTQVSLQMNPGEAYFIVFRTESDPTAAKAVKVDTQTVAATLEGPWTVTFQPDRGAPAQTTMAQLRSLSESDDAGIRYFAGTATYRNSVKLTKAQIRGKRLWINLGQMSALAEVIVNGKNMGILWRAPFSTEITDALRRGNNDIEIRVTTLWRNRIVGDQQPDCPKRYTYTSYPFYKKDSKLQPSGLIGPVTLTETPR